MLIELTERECFLIHRFRTADIATKSRVCYDLDVPMEKSELDERIACHKADILTGIDAEKSAYLERCKRHGEPVNIKTLNSIQAEAESKALRCERLYLSSNAESETRMTVYLSSMGKSLALRMVKNEARKTKKASTRNE